MPETAEMAHSPVAVEVQPGVKTVPQGTVESTTGVAFIPISRCWWGNGHPEIIPHNRQGGNKYVTNKRIETDAWDGVPYGRASVDRDTRQAQSRHDSPWCCSKAQGKNLLRSHFQRSRIIKKMRVQDANGKADEVDREELAVGDLKDILTRAGEMVKARGVNVK